MPLSCKGPPTQVEGHPDLREEPSPPERSVGGTASRQEGGMGWVCKRLERGSHMSPLSPLSFPPDTWRSSQGGAENGPGDFSGTSWPLSQQRAINNHLQGHLLLIFPGPERPPEARTGAGPPEPGEENLTV